MTRQLRHNILTNNFMWLNTIGFKIKGTYMQVFSFHCKSLSQCDETQPILYTLSPTLIYLMWDFCAISNILDVHRKKKNILDLYSPVFSPFQQIWKHGVEMHVMITLQNRSSSPISLSKSPKWIDILLCYKFF